MRKRIGRRLLDIAMTLNSPMNEQTHFFKFLVKLIALKQQKIHLIITIMSSFYSIVF